MIDCLGMSHILIDMSNPQNLNWELPYVALTPSISESVSMYRMKEEPVYSIHDPILLYPLLPQNPKRSVIKTSTKKNSSSSQVTYGTGTLQKGKDLIP